MDLLKEVADGMMYEGGILGTGILGLLLWKKHYLPKYAGAISLCAASVGFCGVVWNICKAKDKEPESSTDEFEEIFETIFSEAELEVAKRLSREKTAQVNEGKKEKEQTKEESLVSRQAKVLKEYSEILRRNGAEAPTVENEDAMIRESTLKEMELLAETGGLAFDLFKKSQKDENDTSNDCKGKVFLASELFKDWDTKLPVMKRELEALSWKGKEVNL